MNKKYIVRLTAEDALEKRQLENCSMYGFCSKLMPARRGQAGPMSDQS